MENQLKDSADAVRIVSYNILADAYIRRGRYPNASATALEPTARRQRLLDQLTHMRADIYCLQEVEPGVHDAISDQLGASFHGHYAGRRGRPDGCSIFARTDTPLECDTLHYACEAKDDRLALIANVNLNGRTLQVVSTHLRWQRHSTSAAEHTGRRQLDELLRVLAERPENPLTLIAGDFNANSQSCVLQTAREHNFVLSCQQQRPWDTCNINGRRRKIDYILYPKGALLPKPQPLPKLEVGRSMPSALDPSDHLPVVVDMTFPG